MKNDGIRFKIIELRNKTFQVDVLQDSPLGGSIEIGYMLLSENTFYPEYLMVTEVEIDSDYQKIGMVSRRIGLRTYEYALKEAQRLGYKGLMSRESNQNMLSHSLWVKYKTHQIDEFYFMEKLIVENKLTFKNFLTESVDFMLAHLKKDDAGRNVFDTTAFEKQLDHCYICNGSGSIEYVQGEKEECDLCHGTGKYIHYEPTYKSLNVSNANLRVVLDLLGIADDGEYYGSIPPEQLVDIKRRLIKLKNSDVASLTIPDQENAPKPRITKDEDGLSRISTGPKIYSFGVSEKQLKNYIDTLLTMVDLAQKSNAYITWG